MEKGKDEEGSKRRGIPSGTYTGELLLPPPQDSLGRCFLWAQWEGRMG